MVEVDPARPDEGAVTTRRGAVGFVDISGFSALTSELFARRGVAGIDQLARVLDARFGAIAALVEQEGGEIVAIAGDALVLWWDGELEDAVARASACALAIQRLLAQEAAVEGVTLRARQVVLAGEFEIARYGGPPHAWWVVLGGPPMLALASLSSRAPVGGVLVDDTASTWVRGPSVPAPDGGAGRLLTGAYARAPAGASPLAPTLREPESWLEPAHLARARSLESPTAAELRSMAVLFVRVARPEAERAYRARAAVRAVQAAIADHLGVAVQVLVDDKGLVVVGAFGLPGADAFRPADPALAAVEIEGALRAAGHSVGVGLATGPIVVADLRLGSCRRIALTGTALNLAARLMMLGEGAWCDSGSARAAAGAVQLGPVRPFRLKGFAGPVAVRQLLDRSAAPAPPPFVGREAELRALAGSAGFVAVVGPPGSGKSALLGQASRRLAADGFTVRMLAGRVGTALEPLRPWRAAVRDGRGADDDGLRAAVLATLGPHAPDAPVLAEVLGTTWPDSESSARLRGFVRAHRAAELVVELLAAVPRLAVVVDDAQWLDPHSLDVLGGLAARGVRVVVAARSGEGRAPELDRLLAHALVLGPLRDAEVVELVGARCQLTTLPDGLGEWVVGASGGNPLFVLELLAGAVDRGLLELDAAGRVLYFDRARLARTGTTATIQAAVAARVDPLPPRSAALLKAASAVGIFVDGRSLGAAAGAAGLDAAAVQEALPALVDGGWVQAAGPEDWVFCSATVHEIVHGLLVQAQLRTLHGAIADHLLERLGPARARSAELAHHLAHAGRVAPALAALAAAYGEALDAGLGRDAAAFALRALDLGEQARAEGAALAPLDEARWRFRVAQACREFGDTDLAQAQLAEASRLLGLGWPAEAAGWRTFLLRQVVLHLAEALVPAALLGGDRTRAHVVADVLNLDAITRYLRSTPEAVLASAVWAVRMGRRAPLAHTAMASSMLVIAVSGVAWVAERYVAAAEQRARRLDEPAERLDAALGRIVLDLVHCRWDDAERLRAELLPWSRARRAGTIHAVYLALFGCVDLVTGRVERLDETCDELCGVAEVKGYLQARGWALNLRANRAWLAGDATAAADLAKEAQTILERHGEPDRLSSRALRARALWSAGDRAAAVRELDALLPLLASEPSMAFTAMEAYAVPAALLAAVAHEAGGAADAMVRADAALAALKRFARQVPLAQSRLLTVRALRQSAAGRADEARALAATAAAHASARGLPVERLMALDLLAESGDDRRTEREALRTALARGWRR